MIGLEQLRVLTYDSIFGLFRCFQDVWNHGIRLVVTWIHNQAASPFSLESIPSAIHQEKLIGSDSGYTIHFRTRTHVLETKYGNTAHNHTRSVTQARPLSGRSVYKILPEEENKCNFLRSY